MRNTFSAISSIFLSLRIHAATSLSPISSQEPVENKAAKKEFQSVLIIGSSVDRYAIHDSFPHQTYCFKQEAHQHTVVGPIGNVGLAVLQHPGVGLNGDLQVPFWDPGKAHTTVKGEEGKYNDARGLPKGTYYDGNPHEDHWTFHPTLDVLSFAPSFSQKAFGTTAPSLVVVESSLWDLATWWQHTGHVATPKRIQQWCDKDVPYLLNKTFESFPNSRIVFRTAPKVSPWSTQRWTQENFKAMHACIMQRAPAQHIGVIDYYDIMEKLIASTSRENLSSLWKPDGYHPASLPGRLYLNKIFKLLGVPPIEAPDESRHLLRDGEAFARVVEDEDDL